MSTQVSGPALFRRVGARAGVGIWRNRGSVLVALAAVALGTGYMAFSAEGAPSAPPTAAVASAGTAASSDCADTAMAAIANKSSNAAQQAYQCMDPSFQQRVPEETFVQQLQTQALPDVSKIARVGDYTTPGGGQMVYYAVDGNGQSIGYIVYLGQDGKVSKIE